MDLKVSLCWAGQPRHAVCRPQDTARPGNAHRQQGRAALGLAGQGDVAAAVLENLTAPVFGGKHYHQHILACNLPHLLSSSIALMLMVHF